MKLIELLLTALCAAAGIGALLVGNYLEATLICLLPIGYFALIKARAMQKKRKEEQEELWKKEQYTFDRWHAQKSVPKEQTAHDRYEARQKEAYDRHRAMQLQQMNMMHQNSTQAAAAQQAARMQGWSDPRAQYGSDLADNIINLWAINSMLNQPSGVHASTISPSGPAVTDTPPSRVDPIQFHSFVNSSSESSSSSSSYSSDTSSDSFGGSDTSSDSF